MKQTKQVKPEEQKTSIKEGSSEHHSIRTFKMQKAAIIARRKALFANEALVQYLQSLSTAMSAYHERSILPFLFYKRGESPREKAAHHLARYFSDLIHRCHEVGDEKNLEEFDNWMRYLSDGYDGGIVHYLTVSDVFFDSQEKKEIKNACDLFLKHNPKSIMTSVLRLTAKGWFETEREVKSPRASRTQLFAASESSQETMAKEMMEEHLVKHVPLRSFGNCFYPDDLDDDIVSAHGLMTIAMEGLTKEPKEPHKGDSVLEPGVVSYNNYLRILLEFNKLILNAVNKVLGKTAGSIQEGDGATLNQPLLPKPASPGLFSGWRQRFVDRAECYSYIVDAVTTFLSPKK